MTFVVHGEVKSSRAFAEKINKEMKWNTYVPNYMESFELFKSI
jgi:metallo-beta-lactamase family protein